MRHLWELKTLGDEGVLLLRFPETQFDVQELIRFYDKIRDTYPKTIPEVENAGYGGWALLSDSGDYRDGWQQGKAYEIGGRRFEKLTAHDTQTTLTELSQYPEAQNLFRTFHSLGLKPIRTRIAEIQSEGKLNWHIDPPDPAFNVRWRAHLVVITNDTAKFKWRLTPEAEVREFSLPADGYLYLARIDLEHCVESKEGVRVHIISDFNIIDGETPVEVVLAS
ncbi:hypothetical protein K2Q00_03725 [Patescibacteria group bacterium]|nr:hypothetical protein [Patescibacteria group bacterium]